MLSKGKKGYITPWFLYKCVDMETLFYTFWKSLPALFFFLSFSICVCLSVCVYIHIFSLSVKKVEREKNRITIDWESSSSRSNFPLQKNNQKGGKRRRKMRAIPSRDSIYIHIKICPAFFAPTTKFSKRMIWYCVIFLPFFYTFTFYIANAQKSKKLSNLMNLNSLEYN